MKEKKALFNGKNFDGWKSTTGGEIKWTIDDGIMTVGPSTGCIYSEEVFGDALVHVEFREPDMPEAHGQDKGNSGVYIQGRYELQVLDSYGIEHPNMSDCGGIYSLFDPELNACKPALEWQTYDIMFRAARFDESGNITEHARVSILQNGLPIQNNVILPRVTPGGLDDKETAYGPLMLQDHGNKVSFRNIWLVKLN